MKFCDLSFATPAENLACDEALLDLGEAGELGAVLRFWEPSQSFVVVGYANHVSTEVNRDFCLRNNIAILRRCSGGGAVLQEPGCLNYALILPIADAVELQGIASTNDYVLQRHQRALQTLLPEPVQKQGHTDLTLAGLKFSGNSQRRKKNFVLFHGSFLLHADLGLMAKVLPQPSQQPAYRRNRAHGDFVRNLNLASKVLKDALMQSWGVTGSLMDVPVPRIEELVNERYGRDSWNFKF